LWRSEYLAYICIMLRQAASRSGRLPTCCGRLQQAAGACSIASRPALWEFVSELGCERITVDYMMAPYMMAPFTVLRTIVIAWRLLGAPRVHHNAFTLV
jgi:hypothetical protein